MHVKYIEKLKKCLYGMQVGELCERSRQKREEDRKLDQKKWLGIIQEKINVSICNGM